MIDQQTGGINISNIWSIQNNIKFGLIEYHIGDTVMLFWKRGDGYPKYLRIGDIGEVKKVELNHLIVDFKGTYGNWIVSAPPCHPVPNGTNTQVKIAKKYMISKQIIRDLKINEILNDI